MFGLAPIQFRRPLHPPPPSKTSEISLPVLSHIDSLPISLCLPFATLYSGWLGSGIKDAAPVHRTRCIHSSHMCSMVERLFVWPRPIIHVIFFSCPPLHLFFGMVHGGGLVPNSLSQTELHPYMVMEILYNCSSMLFHRGKWGGGII
jgi:hypothetical protein